MVGENSLRILYSCCLPVFLGFPGGSDGKESACDAGDLGSIPGLGRNCILTDYLYSYWLPGLYISISTTMMSSLDMEAIHILLYILCTSHDIRHSIINVCAI